MSTIKIFSELHWAVQRPRLIFKLNSQPVEHRIEILNTTPLTEHAVYILNCQQLLDNNTLEIELVDKTDNLNTAETDHWVSIKELHLDGVPLDSKFLPDTTFCHKMSADWTAQMKAQGFDIQDSYTPGSDLRLNGICYIQLPRSAVEYRIMKIWEGYEHTKGFC